MTSRKRIPVACNLEPTGAAAQLLEWQELQAQLIQAEAVEGGGRLTFPVELFEAVTELAQREAACCPFLDLTVERTDATVRVTITSDESAAAPVIALLTGQPG